MTAGALVSRPPLARSHEDRAIDGVLGGVAAWLRAPSWVLRLAFGFAVFAHRGCSPATFWPRSPCPPRAARGFDWGAVLGLGRLAAILVGLPFLVIWAGAFDTPAPDVWVPLGGLGFVGLFALGMHRGPTRSSDDRTVVPRRRRAHACPRAPRARARRRARRALGSNGGSAPTRGGCRARRASRAPPRIRALLVPVSCLAALALLLAAADVQLAGGVGEASRRPATSDGGGVGARDVRRRMRQMSPRVLQRLIVERPLAPLAWILVEPQSNLPDELKRVILRNVKQEPTDPPALPTLWRTKLRSTLRGIDHAAQVDHCVLGGLIGIGWRMDELGADTSLDATCKRIEDTRDAEWAPRPLNDLDVPGGVIRAFVGTGSSFSRITTVQREN